MAVLMPEGKQSFTTNAGAPLVGGKLYTYAAGTSTPKATYTAANGATPNANPVIMDARGEATIFWNGAYKITLRDSLDNLIWTLDNVTDSSTLSQAQVTALSATLATASGGSAVIGWIQIGAAAVLRFLQSKLRDLPLSPKDFGAVGNGVTDDTASLQAMFDTAIANNKAIYFPGGTYLYTSLVITLTGAASARGLRITGDSTNNLQGRGAILKCTTAGTNFLIDGSAAQAFLDISGVTFLGSSACDIGLEIRSATFVNLTACPFIGYSKATAKALYLNGTSGFVGDIYLSGCMFETNSTGIFADAPGGQINVVDIQRCNFLDQTVAAIKLGGDASLMQMRTVNIHSASTFEGCAQSIITNAAMYSLDISGNYFENNNIADTAPMIDIKYNGVSPNGSPVVITKNGFQKTIAVGSSVIVTNGPGITVKDNWCPTVGSPTAYFLTALYCGNDYELEPAYTAPGITPLPIRRSGGVVGTAITFTTRVVSRMPMIPLGGGSASTIVLYQGSSVPDNANGAIGDYYFNSDNSVGKGKRGIYQKGAFVWANILAGTCNVVPYSNNMIPNLENGLWNTIEPTNNAVFTVAPPTAAIGFPIWTLTIIKNTGAALGVATFTSTAGGYKLSAAWVQPATGNRRSITFAYDATAGFNYEVSRNTADVPNS